MSAQKNHKKDATFATIGIVVGLVAILFCHTNIEKNQGSSDWYGGLLGLLILGCGFVISTICSLVSLVRVENPMLLRLGSFLIIPLMYLYFQSLKQ